MADLATALREARAIYDAQYKFLVDLGVYQPEAGQRNFLANDAVKKIRASLSSEADRGSFDARLKQPDFYTGDPTAVTALGAAVPGAGAPLARASVPPIARSPGAPLAFATGATSGTWMERVLGDEMRDTEANQRALLMIDGFLTWVNAEVAADRVQLERRFDDRSKMKKLWDWYWVSQPLSAAGSTDPDVFKQIKGDRVHAEHIFHVMMDYPDTGNKLGWGAGFLITAVVLGADLGFLLTGKINADTPLIGFISPLMVGDALATADLTASLQDVVVNKVLAYNPLLDSFVDQLPVSQKVFAQSALTILALFSLGSAEVVQGDAIKHPWYEMDQNNLSEVAEALLKSMFLGNPGAIARVGRHVPRPEHDAQGLVNAMAYGTIAGTLFMLTISAQLNAKILMTGEVQKQISDYDPENYASPMQSTSFRDVVRAVYTDFYNRAGAWNLVNVGLIFTQSLYNATTGTADLIAHRNLADESLGLRALSALGSAAASFFFLSAMTGWKYKDDPAQAFGDTENNNWDNGYISDHSNTPTCEAYPELCEDTEEGQEIDTLDEMAGAGADEVVWRIFIGAMEGFVSGIAEHPEQVARAFATVNMMGQTSALLAQAATTAKADYIQSGQDETDPWYTVTDTMTMLPGIQWLALSVFGGMDVGMTAALFLHEKPKDFWDVLDDIPYLAPFVMGLAIQIENYKIAQQVAQDSATATGELVYAWGAGNPSGVPAALLEYVGVAVVSFLLGRVRLNKKTKLDGILTIEAGKFRVAASIGPIGQEDAFGVRLAFEFGEYPRTVDEVRAELTQARAGLAALAQSDDPLQAQRCREAGERVAHLARELRGMGDLDTLWVDAEQGRAAIEKQIREQGESPELVRGYHRARAEELELAQGVNDDLLTHVTTLAAGSSVFFNPSDPSHVALLREVLSGYGLPVADDTPVATLMAAYRLTSQALSGRAVDLKFAMVKGLYLELKGQLEAEQVLLARAREEELTKAREA